MPRRDPIRPGEGGFSLTVARLARRQRSDSDAAHVVHLALEAERQEAFRDVAEWVLAQQRTGKIVVSPSASLDIRRVLADLTMRLRNAPSVIPNGDARGEPTDRRAVHLVARATAAGERQLAGNIEKIRRDRNADLDEDDDAEG